VVSFEADPDGDIERRAAVDRLKRVPIGWVSAAIAAGVVAAGCGAPAGPAPAAPPVAAAKASSAPAAQKAGEASTLTDDVPFAFLSDFPDVEVGPPWNQFGVKAGNREVKGGPDGLWVRIADAEKEWDAVGARTARIKVDGDFDLRGRFRDFSVPANGSTKLIIVDAASPRGEAAYVERIEIDGKSLFKFGGEVDGTLMTWGFVKTDAKKGDLRIVRQGAMLHGYQRTDDRGVWSEIGKPQAAPKSMPRVVKFGVKLSAGEHKSAQARWIEIAMDGKLVRTD
jgi:hypothetical protein